MATPPILVTQPMLEAGYQEVLKVAKEQRLLWAVKRFPRSFINAILEEGFMAMYDARGEKK